MFSHKRAARVIFFNELILPFGGMSHSQLLQCFEYDRFSEEPDYEMGTLKKQSEQEQIRNVFRYIILMSMDVAIQYELVLNDWVLIAAEFLAEIYIPIITPEAFEKLFNDVFNASLKEIEKITKQQQNQENLYDDFEEYDDEFSDGKIQQASIEFTDKKPYKVLNCGYCQEIKTCKRNIPADCLFTNAVQKALPTRDRLHHPTVNNGEIKTIINPAVINNSETKNKLNGIWNYFYINSRQYNK